MFFAWALPGHSSDEVQKLNAEGIRLYRARDYVGALTTLKSAINSAAPDSLDQLSAYENIMLVLDALHCSDAEAWPLRHQACLLRHKLRGENIPAEFDASSYEEAQSNTVTKQKLRDEQEKRQLDLKEEKQQQTLKEQKQQRELEEAGQQQALQELKQQELYQKHQTEEALKDPLANHAMELALQRVRGHISSFRDVFGYKIQSTQIRKLPPDAFKVGCDVLAQMRSGDQAKSSKIAYRVVLDTTPEGDLKITSFRIYTEGGLPVPAF